jgi:hypothetical protein
VNPLRVEVSVDEERQDGVPWRLDPETKTIVSVDGRPLDQAFWLSRPSGERMRALETLRRAVWGEAATAPMQKVLEIVEVDWK